MAITIYHSGGSPFSRRAVIAAKEKKIDFTTKNMTPSAGDLKTPEYLAINPRAKVPAMDDNGDYVCESLAIVLYLDAKYDAHSLKSNQATVIQRVIESNDLVSASTPVFGARMGNSEITTEDAGFKEKVDKAKAEINRWNDYLTGDYLCGNEFTAADIALGPVFLVMEHYGIDFSSFSNIKSYIDRIKERPSFKETHPSDWAEPQKTLSGIF